MGATLDFFLRYEVPSFGIAGADVDGAKVSGVRIVPAAGAASAGEAPNRAAHALAERLGVPVVTFPGDHGGFGTRHREFAATLARVLGEG